MHIHLLILVIFICWPLPIASQEYDSSKSNQQAVTVFDKEVEFSGWRGDYGNASKINEIRIGLFLPMNSDDEINSSFQKAADLAIEEINNSRGQSSLPYRLIKRWSDDPWGAGSKEMIKLVYEDSVWAVIGSQNGETSHIAEQIVTKAFLPLISPLSGDPTLNYIRIPWIFRLPPDFQSQARVIVNDGIKTNELKRVGLISSTNHDGRIFADEMREEIKTLNQSLIFHFEISEKDLKITEIIKRAKSFQPDGLILHMESSEIIKLFFELSKDKIKIPIFLPWIPNLDTDLISEKNNEYIYFIDPFKKSQNSEWESFQHRYKNRYGSNPNAGAAFTYDSVYLLVHAIEKNGLNRAAIRDAIAKSDYLNPITGKILWDNTGGNQIKPVLRKSLAE